MKNSKKGRLKRWFYKILNSRLFKPFKKLWDIFLNRMKKSIRFELVVVFGVCFIIALIAFGIGNSLFSGKVTESHMEYDQSVNNINYRAEDLVRSINSSKLSSSETDKLKAIIKNNFSNRSDDKVVITDLDGNVIVKSDNASETKIDIYTMLKNSIESNNIRKNNFEGKRVDGIYPINLKDTKAYVITSAVPTAQLIEHTYVRKNSLLALLVAVASFIISFIIITNNQMKYIQEISKGLKEISTGDLSYRIPKKSEDELGTLAGNINFMAQEIQIKIENERKAEKTKNELITNVSHDLRTPLTSVMGYLGLVKDGKYSDEKEMKEYLSIAFNKAERLKILIDDLFEYTKLTNANVNIELRKVNLNEFLEQLIEELRPYYEENELTLKVFLPEEKVYVNVDTNKMLRVFENLFTNAIKYSRKPSDVKINLEKFTETAVFSISNIGESLSKEKLSRIFERFYRADEARNSSVSGSGLGLAITKNIVELHGGKVWANCEGESITFYVQLPLFKENSYEN